MDYQRKNRSKYLIVYHLIFVIKYRKPLLVRYGHRIKEIMLQVHRNLILRLENCKLTVTTFT